ncbi:MAG TPA: hypothetical protein DCK93_11245, partial [Blastocatellia bacterium]|nr:hypothetical protein [Blastocatellia bacterium]
LLDLLFHCLSVYLCRLAAVIYRSEADQLDSFVRFVDVNGLAKYLRTKNWAAFARGYNGPKYKINPYDTKLAAAYKKFGG